MTRLLNVWFLASAMVSQGAYAGVSEDFSFAHLIRSFAETEPLNQSRLNVDEINGEWSIVALTATQENDFQRSWTGYLARRLPFTLLGAEIADPYYQGWWSSFKDCFYESGRRIEGVADCKRDLQDQTLYVHGDQSVSWVSSEGGRLRDRDRQMFILSLSAGSDRQSLRVSSSERFDWKRLHDAVWVTNGDRSTLHRVNHSDLILECRLVRSAKSASRSAEPSPRLVCLEGAVPVQDPTTGERKVPIHSQLVFVFEKVQGLR